MWCFGLDYDTFSHHLYYSVFKLFAEHIARVNPMTLELSVCSLQKVKFI